MAAAPAALAQLSESADANANTAANANRQPSLSNPPSPLRTEGVSLVLQPPPGPVAAGATFKVPVLLNGGANIAAVPLQIQYDPARLSLDNVALGDFLGRDGQNVALLHRDDGPGSLTISTARPPGAAGVSGAGVVCVLSFQAKSAGESVITITRAAAVNSAQQQVPATGGRVTIVVH